MLPNRPLTNFDLLKCIKSLKIPHFRGVFMRDSLPNEKPWQKECMIVNHDSIKNIGTHWTCFVKEKENAYYFDSFGKLAPPIELVTYLGSKTQIFYNYERFQKFCTVICGHLCLRFLYEFYRQE